MEGFISCCSSKSGERVYICALCSDGKSEKVRKRYVSAAEKADFTGIKHDYFIDVKLYETTQEVDSTDVYALGIGIEIADALHIGGGIIGSPRDDSESADDKADYIGNGLWCIAFGGRFGAVFKADKEKAEEISDMITDFNNRCGIKNAIMNTKEYLIKNTYVFLILSDGSGKGAYPYCAAFDGKNYYED